MDSFGGYRPPEIDPAQLRRAIVVGRVLLALLLAFVLVAAAVGPYTAYLWYRHDARQPEVYATEYRTRGTLFALAFLPAWLLLWGSLDRAFRITLVFLRAPENRGALMFTAALTWVQANGRGVVRGVAPLLALFFALGFSNEWNTLLLARHRQAFGVADPTFGIDLGFFVFSLPWLRALANAAFSLLFLTTLVSVAVYAGLQALAALVRIELARPAIRMHVGLLLAATGLAYAAQTWLKRYETGLVDNAQFTGAGYAGMQALGAQTVLVGLVVLVALAVAVNGRFGRPYVAARYGGAGLVAFYVLGLIVWPEAVQRVVVDPNRLEKEAPYAERAIAMTRYAYGLDRIDVRDIAPTLAPTSTEVAGASATLDNMRLWDPEVLRQALEGLQGIRSYYSFRDVDVDRYTLAGKPTLVMLATRQIDLDGLQPSARNWANQRLRFTHGYGVVATRVDRAESDGSPSYLASDIPQRTVPTGGGESPLRVVEPRIYYGDSRDPSGRAVDEYAIVATGEPEVDYATPTGAETHTWKGDRGIPIGGILSRLAFAATLGDGNLLVSPKVVGGSRLLLHRNIIDRARRIYPFLSFDADPYAVVLDGRVVWVLDGYTTTDDVPYAAHVGVGGRRLGYIRNSVKATVDAYTGKTTAYAVEPDEPLLRAYRAVYPGLVRDAGEAPEGLAAHWRYPEDLLTLQSDVLGAYHVTDPTIFLSNGDGWTVARERGLGGEGETIRPYYVELRLPDEPTPGFVQILPFTPAGKPNMIGWLAAHGDPDRYGRVTLYRLAQNPPIAGPEQIEAKFSAQPEISNINRQFNNDQSRVVVGNLLVIPVGRSFLYAESLFLQAKSEGVQPIPRLTKVILAHNDRIVVGDTYREALAALFGGTKPADDVAPDVPVVPGAAPNGVRETLDLLDRADAALRAGDFARYGELQKAARAKLKAMAK